MAEVCCGLPWAAVVVQKDIYVGLGILLAEIARPTSGAGGLAGPCKADEMDEACTRCQNRAVVGCERPNCTPGDN